MENSAEEKKAIQAKMENSAEEKRIKTASVEMELITIKEK